MVARQRLRPARVLALTHGTHLSSVIHPLRRLGREPDVIAWGVELSLNVQGAN